MNNEITEMIMKDCDLLNLYQNDKTFKNCIETANDYNMDKISTLIFALLEGYKEKDNIFKNYVKEMEKRGSTFV